MEPALIKHCWNTSLFLSHVFFYLWAHKYFLLQPEEMSFLSDNRVSFRCSPWNPRISMILLQINWYLMHLKYSGFFCIGWLGQILVHTAVLKVRGLLCTVCHPRLSFFSLYTWVHQHSQCLCAFSSAPSAPLNDLYTLCICAIILHENKILQNEPFAWIIGKCSRFLFSFRKTESKDLQIIR